MNNYTNPLILIKEEYLEATTFTQKSLVFLFAAWAFVLFFLFAVGFSTIVWELITNPSTFSNATWGIFDTLGQ
jgi:hypothetical protein|tara:strand:+ start:433 stop:651 length:219 start_codon:yes stop_codon:yes gene_type:complete